MPDLATELKEKVIKPVVIDRDVFNEICRAVCPHCRADRAARLRVETHEWTHDIKVKKPTIESFTHTICWASGFRNSRFAELVK